MKFLLPFISMLCMGITLHAQYVYTIKADSVKITNTCDTAELILENHTQNISGFLFNKGKGRTEFRKAVIKQNDSTYIFGGDTVTLAVPLQANNGVSMLNRNIVLGQNPGQAGNPAVFLNHRELPSGNFNLSLTGGGSFLINSNTLEGNEKLQVANSIAVVDTPGLGRFTINKVSNTASIKFNSVSSTSPTLTFVDNRGFVIGGNGQTTPLAASSLISIYPKNTNDGFDPVINIQPYAGNFYLRALAAKNLSTGGFAGCGLHFQNDLNRTLQLYVTGSGTSITTGGPDASVLWSSAGNGLRLTATSTDPNAGIIFTTRTAAHAGIRGLINNTGNWILQDSTTTPVDNGAKLQVKGNETVSGSIGIGGITVSTAKMHIGSGTSSAGTAPVKLTPGVLLTTPEDGAIEYDGADLYLTQNTIRYKLAKTLTGQLTTSFGAPALTAYNAVSTTLSVPGVQPGDVVMVNANTGAVNPPSIIITAYVTSANTVTLQAYNAGNSTVNIASDTYKVRIVQ